MLRFPQLLFLGLLAASTGCGDSEAGPNGGNEATNANTQPNSSSGNVATNSSTSNATTNNSSNVAPNNASGCPLPAPFDTAATYTNEVRVEPGEDLEATIRQATAGTRITVAAGTHPGDISAQNLTGTASNPIAIVGEDGAVIEGGLNNIQLSTPSYVIIENITFRGGSGNGLNIDDGGDYSSPANNVILRNIVVENVGDGGNQDCIKLSGLDDFHIEGVDVSGCSGQGIDMVGCHDGVITGNMLRDTPGAGVQAKGGTADVLVHGNTFERVRGRGVNAGGSTGLEFFRPIDAPHEGARIEVVSNVFVDVGESSGAPIAFVGCDACTFVNNTVVRPLTWVARILQETTGARFVPSRDGVFANNIIVFDSNVLRTFVNVGADTAPETFTFRNNLWWDTANPDFTGPTWNGPPDEVDGAVGDPGLDDDYRIAAGSPAVGLGRDAANLPDRAGRCYDDPPSAGAHEVP